MRSAKLNGTRRHREQLPSILEKQALVDHAKQGTNLVAMSTSGRRVGSARKQATGREKNAAALFFILIRWKVNKRERGLFVFSLAFSEAVCFLLNMPDVFYVVSALKARGFKAGPGGAHERKERERDAIPMFHFHDGRLFNCSTTDSVPVE